MSSRLCPPSTSTTTAQSHYSHLPSPPESDACINSPDTPRQFHIAQQAGMAARERYETLQRTSRLLPPNNQQQSLMLLTWDDLCVEEFLGMGGFASVCLVTCPKLWKTHKRQYLQRKYNTSDCLDSVDSSLLPPSEDSWCSSSSCSGSSSTSSVRTNEEKYYACKCLSKRTIEQGYRQQQQQQQQQNDNNLDNHKTRFAGAAADLVEEAFLLSKLDHPNIIRLYGVTSGPVDQAFLHKGGFFLVMEALNNVLDDMIQKWRSELHNNTTMDASYPISVGDFLRKKNKSSTTIETAAVPSVEERLAMALDIARGMNYLHSKCIIFRDLKPHNVGIDRGGGFRLFDFGLAREVATHSGICPGKAGSRRYMAPETIMNNVTCFASDVYSFGITLWELVSLIRPEDFQHPEQFEKAVCVDGYRPPISAIEKPAIRNLVERCWHQDYQQRPSFSNIIDMLKGILRESNEGTWINSKAAADVLDGGSFHLSSFSRHSKCDASSYRSLMNESLMTDGSHSRMSALTMESNRTGRSSGSFSVPSISSPPCYVPPEENDTRDSMMVSRPPTRSRPNKSLRNAPPSKNESETTVMISNTARRRRGTSSDQSMSSDDDCCVDAQTRALHRQEIPITPVISNTKHRRIGRGNCPMKTQSARLESMVTTASAPESMMIVEDGDTTSANNNPAKSGNAIQWQRRKKFDRSPGSFRDRKVQRSHSEPLTSLVATISNNKSMGR